MTIKGSQSRVTDHDAFGRHYDDIVWGKPTVANDMDLSKAYMKKMHMEIIRNRNEAMKALYAIYGSKF